MIVWTILLAAGSGTRMKDAGLSTRKQFLDAGGEPVFWKSAKAFSRSAGVSGLVFALPAEEQEALMPQIVELDRQSPLGLKWVGVPGGGAQAGLPGKRLGRAPG